ncbi:MAG: hypothetical protein NTX50_01100, partial [Candidatus Sumerlaeota bacterium]|nr:hypothetical protein [Candidatus Sumerlaeota bacterium]
MNSKRLARRILFPIIAVSGALALCLIALEIALRVVGFSFHLYPDILVAKHPVYTHTDKFVLPDSRYIWVRQGYDSILDDALKNKPAVVFMGDSCTQAGHYDRFLVERVKQESGGKPMTYANLAAVGWTSFQGLLQFQRDVVRIKLAVATMYFGWNDHWVGLGIEDKRIARLRSPLMLNLRRLRVTQLATKFYAALAKESAHEKGKEPEGL